MPRDDDLLARLNALKPTSVNLSSTPVTSVDVEVARPQTVEDKLAARLKGLRNGGHATTITTPDVGTRVDPLSTSSLPFDNVDALTRRTEDDIATDPITNWQHDENDQSIDDLLAELETNEQAKLDPDDPDDVAKLLREASLALPSNDEHTPATAAAHDAIAGQTDEAPERQTDDPDAEDGEDDTAADDYVQRLLAELEVESKYPETPSPSHRHQEDDARTGDVPPSPPSYEDSELEARFNSLSLDLPSTPSSAPVAKSKQPTPKSKSGAPKYTDEDIDSWCCICNEDGEVRCLGCDGDVYCQKCWSEGHGTGVGQERGHRAVVFVRKGGDMGAVGAG